MMMRRLASAILRTALRYASPRAQEWGQAMLREMDFVEGDWAALRWSVGSAATLFRRFEVPLSAPGGVLQRTRVLMGKTRQRTVAGSGACLILLAWSVRNIFHSFNTLQLVGSWLSVAVMLYFLGQLYVRRSETPPLETDSLASGDFYRRELVRQRDFHCGAWLWSRVIMMIPGYLLWSLGFVMAHPAFVGRMRINITVFLVLCVLALPNNLKLARKYRGQIDELDELRKDLR
jgi:hypothetical protein